MLTFLYRNGYTELKCKSVIPVFLVLKRTSFFQVLQSFEIIGKLTIAFRKEITEKNF